MKTCVPSTKIDPSDISSLRIAGFGACMINGYPHKSAGLFEIACGVVEKGLSRPVQSTIVSLGGFPAPRAEKYLKKKVFGFNPQYVVIQFGATDAQCAIRARNRTTDRGAELRGDGNSKPSAALKTASYHGQPATALSLLRWQIASMIGHFRKIEPITPLSSYTAAIGRMVDDCRSAGITPVVLSPFVYGSRYTTAKAIPYVDALHELHSRVQGMILVNCASLLANFPKPMILQHDGFHLSRVGHNLVGEAIGQAIVEHHHQRTRVGDADTTKQ
jgi:lysophospholipase L1-like esterase